MIRVVTLNIWQEQGAWPQRLELTARRLAALAPDVVCLQEVREVEGRVPNQAETLARALQMNYTHEPGQPWGGGTEGVAILSRFPLVQRDWCELPSPEGCRRVCLAAQLQVGADLFWVFTTHLAWRLDEGAMRERQVFEVNRFVRAHAESAVAVLTGDFNAPADADEIRFLRGLTSLEGQRTYYQDAFALCNPGVDGYTWTSENPHTMSWLEPDRRLDYIFVTQRKRNGAGTIHACRIVFSEPDEHGVWCSDHYGVMAEVSVVPEGQG